MNKHLSLSIALICLCIGICHAQEGEVTFTIGQPVKPQLQATSTIISYKSRSVKEDGSLTDSSNYKLYVTGSTRQFQYEVKRKSKGWVAPELVFQRIDFDDADSVYSVVLYDSTLGERRFNVGYLIPGKKYLKSYSWLNSITAGISRPYDYSICIHTDTLIVVNNQSMPCYRIESYYKTPMRLGMYRVKIEEVTYIDKKTLVPVKQVTVVQPIQLHMAIHFSPAERKAFKMKDTIELTAENWF